MAERSQKSTTKSTARQSGTKSKSVQSKTRSCKSSGENNTKACK